jgi:hypothetical protein
LAAVAHIGKRARRPVDTRNPRQISWGGVTFVVENVGISTLERSQKATTTSRRHEADRLWPEREWRTKRR